MKFAIQTRTFKEDYDWYCADDDFKQFANKNWLEWHSEFYAGPWFALISRNRKTLFLSGKIPTARLDRVDRKIENYIVLEPETNADLDLITKLTVSLLSSQQDITSASCPFAQWVESICLPAVEEGKFNLPSMDFGNSINNSSSDHSIGRYEYPLNDQNSKNSIAKSVVALCNSKIDFVIGCVNRPAGKLIDMVCKNMQSDCQIAIFSDKALCKNAIPVREERKENGDSNTPFGKESTRTIPMRTISPLTVCLIVLSTVFLGWSIVLNCQKAKTIHELNKLQEDYGNCVQTIEDLNEQLKGKQTVITQLQNEKQNLEKENAVKQSEVDKLKGQANSLIAEKAQIQTENQNLKKQLETLSKPQDVPAQTPEVTSEPENPVPQTIKSKANP